MMGVGGDRAGLARVAAHDDSPIQGIHPVK